MALQFKIKTTLAGSRARVGELATPHGIIHTPAFIPVGTKATVKTLSPEEVRGLGAQIILANTYHLYLEPGEALIKKSGGLHQFMNWNGPMVTDSGGFQAFSLGAGYGKKISKITQRKESKTNTEEKEMPRLAKVTEDSVIFTSPTDGSTHVFTPEKSIEIQHALGADIIFVFDECTSPTASYSYQKEAMDRTHRWAKRSLTFHQKEKKEKTQGLFGIIQGGRFPELRKESAQVLSELPFAGFGIGGSFEKEDINSIVRIVNDILPEDKPRHLLGIGEPEDLFLAIEAGIDLFDCVAPTRVARNGQLYTKDGKINILNTRFRNDLTPIDVACECYSCMHYSRAYLAHLFRAREILGLRLASIHNLFFIVGLVDQIRSSIEDQIFTKFKNSFLRRFHS